MRSDPFRGRVAVITGGAGGIGFAMAEAFAARGAKIALADLDEAAMDARAKLLRERGTEVLCVRTDVTQRASVNGLAERVFQHFGAAHLVCNNAGIAIAGPLLQMTARRLATHDGHRLLGRRARRRGIRAAHDRAEAGRPRTQYRVDGGARGDVVARRLLRGEIRGGGLHRVAATRTGSARDRRLGAVPDDRRDRHHGELDADAGLEVPKAVAEPDQPPAGALRGGVIGAEEVARRVVRGIERNDLYILTHPEQRELLRRRAARLDEAAPAMRAPRLARASRRAG